MYRIQDHVPSLRAASLLAAFCSLAFSQQTATITGFVADSSGAGIPSALVTLTNQETAVVFSTAKSDSHGEFEFPAVTAPGTYSLSIEISGFTRREEKGITVTAGEDARLERWRSPSAAPRSP